MQRFVEVDSFDKHKIDYVALYLFVDANHVVTVTEKRGSVGFPSGRVNMNDTSVFSAMKREYVEETGNSLPKLENIRRFVYNDDTAIYYATTNDFVSTKLGTKRDGEIIDMYLTNVVYIKDALKGKRFTLRRCAKGSTKLLFKQLGI